MATSAQKAEYNEKLKPLKSQLDAVQKAIKDERTQITRFDNKHSVESYTRHFRLLNQVLNEISLNITISRVSIHLLAIKNENFLNSARKAFYVFIQLIEDLFGKHIDTMMDENLDHLKVLDTVHSNLERFEVFKKAGFLLKKLEHLYGENSKWKWSFVELQGRLVNCMKNAINFQSLIKNLDPSVPAYVERMELLDVLQKNLTVAAERYRSKYELTNKRADDMNCALDFVSFHKRLANILNEPNTVAECKKKFDTWNRKFQEDLEDQENS